jgi:hypothetical protein
MVVSAAMAEREQRGRFADGARTEARPRAVLGAHVAGSAEHGHVSVEPVPVGTERSLAEGAHADEGEIEAAAIIGMHPERSRR